MKRRKSSSGARSQSQSRLASTALALVLALSAHSCANLPSAGKLTAAGAELEALTKGLGTALRKQAGSLAADPTSGRVAAAKPATHAGEVTKDFSACQGFFAGGKPPVVGYRAGHRALCYDAFAILHSGESKTAVYVAQKLNRALVEDADEERTNKFFADARLPSGERSTPADYVGSGYDKGHMAPAGDMPTAQAMAQSFSLANVVPQAPRHNRGAWKSSVEAATRKYAGRASGDVYVITGPVFVPSIAQSKTIGPGKVRVPMYLFKLVYDEDQHRAWAHWHLNSDATQAARPISYAELVRRTGIEFLPGAYLAE